MECTMLHQLIGRSRKIFNSRLPRNLFPDFLTPGSVRNFAFHYAFCTPSSPDSFRSRARHRGASSHQGQGISMDESNKSSFSLSRYDFIGFDLDHTLCKYKLEPLFNLIYNLMVDFLVDKKGYPRDLRQPLTSFGIDFIQKGLVLDKQRGNILKLASDYTILKATHGTKPLSDKEISKIYGAKRIWQSTTNLPDGLCHANAMSEPYYVFKDYFVLPAAIVCARIVDVLDDQHGKNLNQYTFWPDILAGLINMYRHDGFEKKQGGFFTALQNDKNAYLEPCTEKFISWLKYVHTAKKLFLLTSSHFDFACMLAEFCLGPDWQQYFDAIITFARKPGFFTAHRSFLSIHDAHEGEAISSENLQPNTIYSQGNWQDLTHLFSRITGKNEPHVLYFGDSMTEDLFVPTKYTKCESVVVVEEMAAEGMMDINRTHNAAKYLTSEFWGSFFVGYKVPVSNQMTTTLWAKVIEDYSRLAIPYLESIADLSLDQVVPAFDPGNNVFGYYPGIPTPLVRQIN